MNVVEALAYGASQLEVVKIENARRDAQLLLSNAIDRDATFLIAHPEYELTNDETLQFTVYLDRRADREPVQYVIGKLEFYGLEFEVTPDVLIPRPETEILVEAAIKRFAKHNDLRFLEIGVGSGCISVSILKNLPRAQAIGGDISNAALQIARRNADRHHVTERLTLICSDVFAKLNESHFDLIVSNPPYIPHGDIEALEPEVRQFEPRTALEGGADGLDIVRRIVEKSPDHLSSGGIILIEIGWDQSKYVERMFEPATWKTVKFLNDLQGIERIVAAELR